MTATVRIEWVGSVLRLELNRPERRNALSRALLAELVTALEDKGTVGKATAVVITGGTTTFSAGADFAELTGTPEDATFDDEVARVTAAIRQTPRPVLAAIEGPCLGAGCDLALACDVRVAGRSASIGIPAVRLGILYRPESLARIRDSVGAAAAARLLLTGRSVDAETAQRMGLVQDVVEDRLATERAIDLVSGLPLDAVDALAATKAVLSASRQDSSSTADSWRQAYLELLDSPARHELLGSAKRRHSSPSREQRSNT